MCFRGLCHFFRFSVEFFLSHNAEKFRRGESFSVSLISGVENICIRVGEGGEYQDFASKIFCLTVLKNFLGKPLCAVFQKTSGSEKVYG